MNNKGTWRMGAGLALVGSVVLTLEPPDSKSPVLGNKHTQRLLKNHMQDANRSICSGKITIRN